MLPANIGVELVSNHCLIQIITRVSPMQQHTSCICTYVHLSTLECEDLLKFPMELWVTCTLILSNLSFLKGQSYYTCCYNTTPLVSDKQDQRYYPTAMCVYLDRDNNLNSPQWYHYSDFDHAVSSNLIDQWGPARHLSAVRVEAWEQD